VGENLLSLTTGLVANFVWLVGVGQSNPPNDQAMQWIGHTELDKKQVALAFAHVSGDAYWSCSCLKKLLPRAQILTIPLMIGALTSLWLDKILLAIEKNAFPRPVGCP